MNLATRMNETTKASTKTILNVTDDNMQRKKRELSIAAIAAVRFDKRKLFKFGVHHPDGQRALIS
jgi:hypothetical protein